MTYPPMDNEPAGHSSEQGSDISSHAQQGTRDTETTHSRVIAIDFRDRSVREHHAKNPSKNPQSRALETRPPKGWASPNTSISDRLEIDRFDARQFDANGFGASHNDRVEISNSDLSMFRRDTDSDVTADALAGEQAVLLEPERAPTASLFGAGSSALPDGLFDGVIGADRLIVEQVAEFLMRNPFFISKLMDVYPEMVTRILEPHEGLRAHSVGSTTGEEPIVDFGRFMTDRLRRDNDRLNARLSDLIAISRANMAAQQLMHEGILAMLSARTFEELIDVVTSDLPRLMSIDVVTLCIEVDDDSMPAPAVPGVISLEPGAIDAVMGYENDIRLDGAIRGHPAIFGHAAGLVRSQALLRLMVGEDAPAGMLALGTREELQFEDGQGTELLDFMAKSFESCLRLHLDAGE